jgi:hypothetical protein
LPPLAAQPLPPPPIKTAYTQVVPVGIVTVVPDVIVCLNANVVGLYPADAAGNVLIPITLSPL